MNDIDGVPTGHVSGWTGVPIWIVRDGTIKPAAKVVLLCLMARVNATGECWPSHKTLAQESGQSERSVRVHLADLRARGLISWRHRASSAGDLTSNAYRMHVTMPFGGTADSAPPPPAESAPPVRQILPHPPAESAEELDPVELDPDGRQEKGTRDTCPGCGNDLAGELIHACNGNLLKPKTRRKATDTYPGITTDPDENAAQLAELHARQRPEVEELLTYLADKIAANGVPRPVWEPRDRGRILSILDDDKKPQTPEQIRAVIDWCQQDAHWAPLILSVAQFKAKYWTLMLKARSALTGQTPGTRPAGNRTFKRTTDDRVRDGFALAEKWRGIEQGTTPSNLQIEG